MNLITVEELAQKIHSTKGAIYTWVSMRKMIPTSCVVKLGRKLLFDLEGINDWLNNARLAPLPSQA